MSARISVCMIAQNEAARIARALESVAWADEIVVIDGGSADDTVGIAERLGARVEVHPWPGNFGVQIQRSVDATGGDWVFRLDADEAVTPELAAQLRAAADRPDAPDAYRVRRRNYFLGRWVRHGGWWPDPQLRMVRRDRVKVAGAPGHETLAVDAGARRVERYSDHLAPDRARRRRITPWRLFAHPAAAFGRKYFVQQGWRDGTHGFLIAAIHAMVKFSVYAKAWELQREKEVR